MEEVSVITVPVIRASPPQPQRLIVGRTNRTKRTGLRRPQAGRAAGHVRERRGLEARTIIRRLARPASQRKSSDPFMFGVLSEANRVHGPKRRGRRRDQPSGRSKNAAAQ
jgi:hypothetical protein